MKNAKKETEKRERKTEWSQLEKQKDGSWRKKMQECDYQGCKIIQKEKKIFFSKKICIYKKKVVSLQLI